MSLVAHVFTKGKCEPNPGFGAFGVVFLDERGEVLGAEGLFAGDDCTNNTVEYDAVVFALRNLERYYGCDNNDDVMVKFYINSDVGAQLDGKRAVRQDRLKPLYAQVKELERPFGKVYYFRARRSDSCVKIAREVAEMAWRARG